MAALCARSFGVGTRTTGTRRLAYQPGVRGFLPWHSVAEWDGKRQRRQDRRPIGMGLRRAREGIPERRLVLAVLLDALQTVAGGVSSAQSARHVCEAQEWISSEDRHWPFSFLNLCEVLDLHPRAVRDYATHCPEGRTRRAPERGPRIADEISER